MTSNPVLIYANGIGDHLVTLPAVRALSHFFEGSLELVTHPGVAGLYYRELPLARIVETVFRDRPDGSKWFDAGETARNIAGTPLLISLNPWHSEAMDNLLASCPDALSVGMAPEFSVYVPFDQSVHSADLAFHVAQHVARESRIGDYVYPVKLDSEAVARAAGIRSTLPAAARLLVVHGDTQPWKEWKTEWLNTAVNRFLGSADDFFAMVVGVRDVGLSGDRIFSTVGLPMEVSLALTAQADLFFGIDSCHLHMADLHGVSGVGLFGATHATEWGFRFAPHVHVDCGAEMDRACVDEVVSALLGMR